jgi:hypothetical protein
MEVKDVISLALSALAFLVSIVVAARTRYYNRATLRAAHRANYMNALLNLNREIMGHPELWSVYDAQWRPSEFDSATETARRRAFIWYHLNLFELFYTDYHQQRNDAPDSDAREHWDAWDRYIRSFLNSSDEARVIVSDPDAMALLHREFRDYLIGCLPKTIVRDRG